MRPTSAVFNLADRFVAQDKRPARFLPLDISTLAPHHRVLLTGDGLTTTVLAAWWNEPVRVSLTHRRWTDHTDPRAHWLDVTPVDDVEIREVIIMGAWTGNPLAHAQTLYVPNRVMPSVNALIDEVGIGRALSWCEIETRRELLWYGRPGGTQAARTYRIFIHDRPVFLVTEEFVR